MWKNKTPRGCKNNIEIGYILNKLENNNPFVVNNDKTNGSISITTKKYDYGGWKIWKFGKVDW